MSRLEDLALEGPYKEYRAMAFWRDDFSSAHQLATRFAGEKGRIATLPDIIDARIDEEELPYPENLMVDTPAWSQYFNTLSGEYFGFSKAGNPLIVVAHGIGPLSTPEGIIGAYTSPLKPERHGRTGTEGRISHKDFLDLVEGKFGDVAIVDFIDYMRRYEYPFIQSLSVAQSLEDPLVQARLGTRFEEYIMKHAKKADEHADYQNKGRAAGLVETYGMTITRQVNQERFQILTMSDASNSGYHCSGKEVAPQANLLSISQLRYLNGEALNSEVYCKTGLDSCRLIGIRGVDPINEICPSVSIDNYTIGRYLPKFWVSTSGNIQLPELMKLTNLGIMNFVEHADEDGKGTGEIAYRVTDREELHDQVTFKTTIHGYYGIFRYDVKDVMALAPRDANAYYWAGDVKIVDDGNTHEVPVQFCRVEVDTTQVIPRHKEIEEDFDTMMWIATKQ